MTRKELQALVRQGEHGTLEFKKKAAHPEKIVREVVAFANTQGGTLLVGVADNGDISGIPYPEEEMWVLDKAIETLCRPAIAYSTESIAVEGGWVVRYQIEEGAEKPYYVLEKPSSEPPAPAPLTKKRLANRPKQPGTAASQTISYRKKTYIRKNDRSIQASREMREILRRRNGERNTAISWGPAEQILLQYLDEHQTITVRAFSRAAQISRSVAAGILIRMVLAGVVRIIPSEVEDSYVAVSLLP